MPFGWEIAMVSGFSGLSVSGYRRLKSVDISLRRLNVLIGANGVGKSSILDVLHLLGVSADRRLATAVLEKGGLQSILTADGRTSELSVQVRYQPETAGYISYELTLKEAGALPVLSIDNERLFQSSIGELLDDAATEPDKNYHRSETALSQAPAMGKASDFRYILASTSAIYHSLDISERAPIKTPQRLYPTRAPGANGEDLLSCLWTIRETARDNYEAIEDSLRAAFPSFERLEFPPVAAGSFSLGWRDSNFTRPLYANELSEGTLRFLWLITLLQSPGLPKITLIDEPEVSLHPELLRILTELMREASERTQLFVATHSDRFVRFLHPDELIVCDLDEGAGMTAQWAGSLDLKEWLEDYTLDQLWSKGILGGRS
jgi:predicted ATPase